MTPASPPPLDLQALRQAAEAASRRRSVPRDPRRGGLQCPKCGGEHYCCTNSDEREAHRAFIAAFDPPTALALLDRLEAAEQALAAREAVESAAGWRPIESAPRDGTEVDIWVTGPGSGRIADCRWAKPLKANWGDRYGHDTDLPEQWITRAGFALDRRNGRATHWNVPLPPPPVLSRSPLDGRAEG